MIKKKYRRNKISAKVKYSTYWQNAIVLVIGIAILSTLSIGYSLLRQDFNINGVAIVRGQSLIRIDSMSASTTNGAIENYNSYYLNDRMVFGLELPNLNSAVTYTSTITNNTSNKQKITSISSNDWSNPNIVYSISGVDEGTVIDAGSTITYTVTINYDSNLAYLPENTIINGQIAFAFETYEEEVIETEYIEEFNVCNNFTTQNMTTSCNNGILTVTATSGDPQMTFVFDEALDHHKYHYAVIKYKVASNAPGFMELFATPTPTDQSLSFRQDLIGDNNWRLITINLNDNSAVTALDGLVGYRLDPTTKNGLAMLIDYVKFTDDPSIKYGYYEDFDDWRPYDSTTNTGFALVNSLYSVEPESQLILHSQSGDPQLKVYLSPEESFDVSKYCYLYVKYRTAASTSNLGRMEFFIGREDPNYSIYTTTLTGDKQWHEAIFNLSQSNNIMSLGTISFYRFDFTNVNNLIMYFDYIKFSDVVY